MQDKKQFFWVAWRRSREGQIHLKFDAEPTKGLDYVRPLFRSTYQLDASGKPLKVAEEALIRAKICHHLGIEGSDLGAIYPHPNESGKLIIEKLDTYYEIEKDGKYVEKPLERNAPVYDFWARDDSVLFNDGNPYFGI